MTPQEINHAELERLRDDIRNGVAIDWSKESRLADIDDMLAESHYTMEAIDRVNRADDELEKLVNGERPTG